MLAGLVYYDEMVEGFELLLTAGDATREKKQKSGGVVSVIFSGFVVFIVEPKPPNT